MVTAFVLGFVQGAITALLAIVNKTALLGVVGGLINIAKTLKSNKKATKYTLLNAFIDGFSTVVVVSSLSKLVGNILNKKATPIADLLVSYFVEEIFD